MHDFIQSLAFIGSQPALVPVVRPAAEPLRGIMRSFETVPATYGPSARSSGRRDPKSRIKTRK